MPEWYAQRHLKWESAHQSSHTLSSTCLCYKLPGAWLLWHRYAKKHLITSSEFTYMCFYMPLLQSCLGGTPFGARSSGPDSCGIGMPKSIWLHHRSHTCASTCLCYKVAWVHSVRGPKFGARLLWHRYAKKHLITSSEFTYMCFYMPLLQSCLGAIGSWPEVRGPTLVAQVCPKTFDYIIRIHIHVLLRTCLCYKVAWGHPVRGPKFGARLLWHRYGIRTRWIETHVCPLLLLWDEARNPII